MNIDGSHVLITGASRGLGRALGMELARRGARHLVLVARGEEALGEAAESVAELGAAPHVIAADLADPSVATEIAQRAFEATGGRLDALVHNASALGPVPMPELSDLDPEDLRRVVETNVLGPFRLGRAVLGPMQLQGAGLVVTVSSDAAVGAYPGWGAYGATKAAFDHLSRIWAAELAGSGVRGIIVDPGEMDTVMHAAAIPDADPGTLASPATIAERLADAMAAPGVASGARLYLGGPA